MPGRPLLHALSRPFVALTRPLKRWAWGTRQRWLRGLLLEVTSLVDFLTVATNVQNGALLLNHRSFGGNFAFGHTLMAVGHQRARAEIGRGNLRGSHFMGLPIVGWDPAAFVTNSGPIHVSQPARGVLRAHMEDHALQAAHKVPDLEAVRASCAGILAEWVEDPKLRTMWSVRGAVTRVLCRVLADVDVPKAAADEITYQYLLRFGQLSMFAHYAPWLLSVLGSRKALRRDVYLPLAAYGIDNLKVDMILFAGMFSVGTVVMSCVEFAASEDIDYAALSPQQRMAFVIETLRLHPTVSTVHRVVEGREEFDLSGQTLTLEAGDEIAYPMVCINRDPAAFSEPERFRLDRPREEVARVLSWSQGPHMCPVKDLSIVVTVIMLDALAQKLGDLRKVSIFNMEV